MTPLKTPAERLNDVLRRNTHGEDTNQWFGFSTEFFIRLESAMRNQWTLNQAEIARMAEDAACDADAKAGDGEYKIGHHI